MDPMRAERSDLQTRKRRPDRLAFFLVTAILALLAGTIAVFYAWYVPGERHAAVQTLSERLAATADDRAASIESWLDQRLADASCVASFPTVVAVATGPGDPSDPEAPVHVAAILDREAAAYGYRDAWVLDAAGRVRATAAINRSADARLPESLVAKFHEDGGRVLLGRNEANELRATFVAPVSSGGFVVLASDPNDFLYPLLRRESTPTRTGETLLVARHGETLVFLSPLRFADTAPLELQVPWGAAEGLAAHAAAAGEGRTGPFEDYRRQAVFAATRGLGTTGWGLVQKVDRDEALAGFNSHVRAVEVATLAVFVALLGLVYGLWIRRRTALTAKAQRSELRFRATFEQSVVGMAHIGTDGRFLAVNQPLCALLGYARPELLQRTFAEVTHPDDVATDMATLGRLLSGEVSAWSGEKRYLRKDGGTVWVSVTISPVRDPRGRLQYLIAAARDNTERRAAQGRATTLASIYKALGETHEAIARIADEDALYQRVCDIVIALGGSLAAWVGVRDGPRLALRAVAGPLRDAVSALTFDLDPASTDGTWPACEAFRAQQVQVRNRAPSEAGMGREDRSGLRDVESSVCLPLRRRGEVVGVLAIGSGEPGGFAPEIVALFDRMAMNISFGLDKLAEARDRALAIARLEESVSLYRAIARSLPDGAVLVVDRDLRYVMADGGIVGEYSADGLPLEGRLVIEALEPRTAEYIAEHFRDALDGKGATYEAMLGNRILWCQYAPIRDASGAVTAAMAVVLDVTRRRTAEIALREREQEMSDTLQTALDGYCVVDATTRRILEANPVFCDMHGYSREDLLGMRLPDLQAEESEPEALASTLGMRQFGRDRVLARHRRKDGRPIDVELSLTRHEFGGGRFVAFCRDVTERLQLEPEREITIRLLGVLNRVGSLEEMLHDTTMLLAEWSGCDAVGIRMRDGNDFPYRATRGFPHEFVRVENSLCERDGAGQRVRDSDGNPALECLCGNVLCGRFDATKPFFTPRGSFWSNSTSDLLATTTDEDRLARTRTRCNGEGYESVALIALRSGANVLGLIQLNDRRKNRFTVERIALLERLADSVAISIAHREGLQHLRISEERYRSLVENLDDVVFSLDLDSRVTYVSSAVSNFGFAVHEVVGRPLAQFIHPADLPAVRQSLEAGATGDLGPIQFRVYDRSGAIRFVRAASRLQVEDGRPVGLTGVIVDLTAQRRIEEQLRLSQKMEAVGRLAGGVAHDFNNLMSVVLSYVDFALEATPEGSPVRTDLDEIRLAAERAANLTKQLLAFSRRQVLEPEQVSLNRIVEGLQGMLQRLIGEDVRLRTALATDLGDVRVDPGQIEQVIMNLAVNSRDAMPKGGTLTIETSNVDLDEEYAARHVAVRPGPYVLLAVTDSGCGMDAATRAQVFEPFFTTKEPGKGTGLGLATTYGIVKQSGGNIWVYSEPDVGTTFKVYLPRQAAGAGAGLRVKRAHPGGGRGETVLVVEDEVGVRAAVRRILANAGYTVILASGGGEALATCRSHAGSIDLLLTDVVMPGMDGREVALAVGKMFPDARALFMSGYAENAIVHQGILDAGTHYIAKPFNATELTQRVREILDAAPPDPGPAADAGG